MIKLFQSVFKIKENIVSVLIHNAPIVPGVQTYSAFYTHRLRTSTMFVKKTVKMNSVAWQLSVKQVLVASFWNCFFCILIIHPKKNLIEISPQYYHTL